MLRISLPPNLAAAAARDAVPVRVDLELSVAPPAAFLPGLALLQRWCGTAAPPFFLQLTRVRLRELVAALSGQPVFFSREGAPLAWRGDELTGVSVHLAEPVRPSSPANPPPAGAPHPPPARGGAETAPLVVDGSEHFLAIRLPAHEDPRYAAALDLVKTHGFTLEPARRTWWLRDRHKTLNFLAAHRLRLRDGLGARFTDNFERNTAHLRFAEIHAEAAAGGGDYAVTLSLRAGAADEAAVRSAVASGRGYVEAGREIFLLGGEQLDRLARAQRALAEDPSAGPSLRRTHRVGLARLAEAQQILEDVSPGFQPPEAWRRRTDSLRQLTALPPAPVGPELDRQLRPYQRLGAAWLWHLWRNELGGILADEMGLGKTLQALGLLSAIRAASSEASPTGGARIPAPSLVVCPASLLENWRREAARFAPSLRTFVHHGSRRLAGAEDLARADLVLTSYGTLARDRALFAAADFACVIGDEAQHIKNRRSQNAAALRSLRARGRFLLTGTPLENALDDLRSLFEFILPGYLEKLPDQLRAAERGWFDERLKAKAAPYLLRRTKQAVAPELPPRQEQILWCELTPAQAALYRATQEKTERQLLDLASAGAGEGRLRLAALTQLLRLRQICCDPRLVVPPSALAGAAAGAFIPYAESAKLDALNELLAEAVDDGHRVLVFSQFTSLLALLRPELEQQGLAYCYLDGSLPPRARQAEVDRFQASADIPLFLLSLKAGGTGLNLTGADTVVHLYPWWNPAAEAQATDRAHRIGQTRMVTSYKLIAAGTVEEKVLALQEEKRALLADVFEASDAASARLSLADLTGLLKP